MRKLLAITIVYILAFGMSACSSTVENRKEESSRFYKFREICIDGVIYFEPSNGSAPLPKYNQNGTMATCNK